MQFTYQIEFNAPIEEVFHWLVDPQQQQEWKTELLETKWLELYNPENPVGIRFTQTVRQGKNTLELDGEVIEYYHPNIYGVKINKGSLSEEIIYRLEPLTSKQCRLHFKCTVQSRTAASKPKEWFAFLPSRFHHVKQLQRLKQQIEQ
ncbi:hypothetical protein C1X05_16295 [Laceyella sacchari]|jgi:hypothetical protein|uniref:Polyketide cyclase / dehydrase and lipid transport n=2 Tax=Laceyella TaxID=292635 RepID=A0AA45WQN0_9BACL|nr:MULTISPECIES: SRPBCC family protein [Laceyella]AUS10237.1 hypothetical protein C1X05_16295 [Laceyella sacchari]MRG26654.1 hypothetical protein [Laceyella tengchongensis]PRZ16539.1 polyketide cyclase/dehydrase/lipid transport protein [Laceyella sediminis]SMP26095.1 Polyketide cyclase / dehydrase and lipid transport [Laceyella tengchongensis]